MYAHILSTRQKIKAPASPFQPLNKPKIPYTQAERPGNCYRCCRVVAG